MMLWILAFHLIFVVAWFAGLFYLPRLFVYHAMSVDTISITRFNMMERKLYWIIMMPAALLASVFGIWLLIPNWGAYMQQGWMYAKLALVALLWGYHVMCGWLVYRFKQKNNPYSAKFYRFFNEIPTLLLSVIVILAVVKP